MGLLLSIVVLLMLGLGMFQAWQLWFTKRELARLEQRIAESLDDQDLLEFQERLQGLLAETKDAGLSLVQSLERRQEGVKALLSKAEEAEKRLSVRTQLLELAARELAKGAPAKVEAAPALKPKPAPKKAVKAAPKPETPKAPIKPEAAQAAEVPVPAAAPAASPNAETAAEEAARRYSSRPAAGAPAPNRYQRVYELSDQGLSREQIARESGILPGEVDLILNLRPGKRR